MVGRQSKATVVALSLLVGLAVAPGFALAATTDANTAASISGALGQEDATVGQENGALGQDDEANATQEGEGDDANITLDRLTIQTLTLQNVTIQNALIEQATVDGEQRSNLTAGSVTVENATLTNVTFHNVTMTDRGLLTLVVGQTRATPEQNNTLESLEVSDRTIEGLLIHEATVQNASGVQLGEVEGETEQAAQMTADEASLVVENVTVESISQNATDDASSESGTDTETEVDAGDESNDETETETESSDA